MTESKKMSRVIRRRLTSQGEGRSDRQPPGQETVQQPLRSETPGTILKVEAVNFMCHENLAVEFNKNVTFITGQNGSGKSAVLAAVVLCLGGRATATERGNKLSELIRTGQKCAVVKVTLANRGNRAYKPELYGDQITVERTIRENRASYRLLNANGKSVSAKKAHLDYILDAMNIQVDNPIAILTQEESKNFLRSEDPKVKYDLFLRATALKQIQSGYKSARDDIRIANGSLEDKEQNLTTVKDQVRLMENQVNLYKNIDSMKEKVKLLKKQLTWSEVVDLEEKLKEQKKEHRACEEQTEKLSSKRQQLEQLLQDEDRKEEELKRKKDEIMSEMEQERKASEERRQQVEQLRAEHRDVSTRLRKERDRASAFRSDKENLEREIQRLLTESQPDYAAQEQKAQEEENQLKAQVEQLKGAELTRDAHARHCAETVRQQEAKLHQRQAEEHQLRSKVAELADDLERVRSSQTNPRQLFGRWVAAVDRDIEENWRQKRFRKKPIGPVGAHIRLKPGCEEWTPLVETGLANVLKSYLVDDRQDLHLMTSILQKHCANEPQKPRVITSRFLSRVHDVSLHGIDASGADLVSLWSVLDIVHPVVANAVIDQAKAESILLLRTDEEARQTMAYRSNVPRGCHQALTQSGYRYYPDPSYRTYPISVRRQAQYLQVSTEQTITGLQSDLQLQRSQLQDASERVQQARADLQHVIQQEEVAKRQLADGKKQHLQKKYELRLLQGRERAPPVNVQALEDEVQSYRSSLDASEKTVAELERQEQAADQRRSTAEQQEKAAGDQLKQRFSSRPKTIEEELAALAPRKAGLRRKLVQFDERLTEVQRKGGLLQTEVAHTERKCQQKTADAGERVDVRPGTRIDIERRLSSLQRQLSEHDKQPGMDSEQMMDSYQAAQKNQQMIEEDVQELRNHLELLQNMLSERDRRLEDLKISLQSRITQFFYTNLDTRNLSGDIKFDHKKRSLSLSIKVDQEGASKSTLQLSGGERSFSTLAFVMAMWSAMYSPFRMLDEYDVFMDEVNRKISLDMLKEHALSSYNQFVFITPLNVGQQKDPRIDVVRMRPPIRETAD